MTTPDTALLAAAVEATIALERAGIDRDDAIRAANAGGWSVRAIASAIELSSSSKNLSPARVGQIIQEAPKGARQ